MIERKYKKPQRNWSMKERKFLTDNWGILTDSEIAKELNRTPHGISAYARRVLKLPKKKTLS